MGELHNGPDYRDWFRQTVFYLGLFLCTFVLDVKAVMPHFRVLDAPIELGKVQKQLRVGFEGIFVVTEKMVFLISPCFARVDIVELQTPYFEKALDMLRNFCQQYTRKRRVRVAGS